VAALLSLSSTLKTDLVRRLNDRQIVLARNRSVTLAIVVAALALACALAWVITRSITHPLAHAISTFASIAAGRYDNAITLAGTDEAGQVLQSLAAMQSQLRAQIEKERAQAAVNSRLKSALDASTASVAVADENFDLIYMNQAAGRLFHGVQDDFRRDLPAFDASRLIGQNMDVFHKVPGRQRTLLASLTSTHTADIRIGGRHMRLIATPVITEGAGRIGTVVEWLDRTQECKSSRS
jgi:methyl-accepting chemotaxis protein